MKKRMAVYLIFGLMAALAFAACGGSSSVFLPAPLALGDVQTLYNTTSGASWNDYVKGGNIMNATDVACDAATDTACVHAAEIRVVEVTGTDSCTGVTATDSLGAFNWICDDSADPVVVISNGLSSGSGLQDLIDFDALTWRDISVTVSIDGDVYGVSNSSAWWDNTVVINSTGGDLGVEGMIYIIPESVDKVAYSLISNRVSLVAAPGVIVNGPGVGSGSHVITASGTDFFWVEGMIINASGDDAGFFCITSRFSRIHNMVASYADTGSLMYGILLSGAYYLNISDLTASNNGDDGIHLSTFESGTISNLSADNNNNNGIYIGAPSPAITISNLKAKDNLNNGIYLAGVTTSRINNVATTGNAAAGVYLTNDDNTISGLITSNNNYGVHLHNASYNTIMNIIANDISAGLRMEFATDNIISKITTTKGNYGIEFTYSDNNALQDANTSETTSAGIRLNFSTGNTLSGVSVYNNPLDGIALSSSTGNKLSDVKATKNGTNVYLRNNSSNNTLHNVTTSNSNAGIQLDNSNDNTISGITASSNTSYGIYIHGSSGNDLSAITTNNNGNYGVHIYLSSHNTLSGVTSGNNYEGISVDTSSDNTLSGVTATDNFNSGILLFDASNNKFSDKLKVDNNGTNCYVANSVAITDPGLDDDALPADVETDAVHDALCVEQGLSDFGTVTTGVTLAASFVGKVIVNDTVNTNDIDGTAAYPADPTLFDWIGFENSYRNWGKEGSVFPDSENKGKWSTGTGRIWDWSALASDTVIVDSLLYPDTGDIANTLMHSWYSATAANQSDCDTEFPGSTWNGTDSVCETTFLRHAVEILGDEVGNENTLCESGETCLYTPNMGSYQGHGAIINSAPVFSDSGGVITGVTLKEYEFNGY